ncbi:hypothetical protein ACFU9O_08410 [Streptomyces albidoflavus]
MDTDQLLPRELKAADFTPLGRVITREEGLRVVRWAERAPSVRERLLCQVRTGATARGLVGRSSAALVDLRFDLGVLPELLGDTLGAYRGQVVRPAGPDHAAEQGAALAVAEGGGLDGALLLLARDERLAARAARTRTADPHLGAVDA